MKKTRMSVAASGRIAVVSLLAAGLLLAGNSPSWADRDDRQGRQENRYETRHDNRKDGRHDGKYERRDDHRQHKVTVVRELPRGYRNVVVGKTRYYEHDHRYYTRVHNGYALVRPPVGAVVATLPFGSVSLTIGGNFYFCADDVYYRPARRGYIVVAAPFSRPIPVQAGAVMVWTSTLNVRSGPGEHFPVINQAWQGETLLVNGHTPGWYDVLLPGGGSGWVMSGYTRPLAVG